MFIGIDYESFNKTLIKARYSHRKFLDLSFLISVLLKRQDRIKKVLGILFFTTLISFLYKAKDGLE